MPAFQEDDEEELPWQVVGVGAAWQRYVFLLLRAPLEKGLLHATVLENDSQSPVKYLYYDIYYILCEKLAAW